jgi:hypothetical protein
MSLESEVRSFDDWMDALGNVQRRLLALPLTYEEQTDVLVVGGGASIGDAPGPHVQMEHVHLPQLDAYGLNEWDRASGGSCGARRSVTSSRCSSCFGTTRRTSRQGCFDVRPALTGDFFGTVPLRGATHPGHRAGTRSERAERATGVETRRSTSPAELPLVPISLGGWRRRPARHRSPHRIASG